MIILLTWPLLGQELHWSDFLHKPGRRDRIGDCVSPNTVSALVTPATLLPQQFGLELADTVSASAERSDRWKRNARNHANASEATLPYWRGQWSSLVLLPETPFSQKKHKATKSLLARKRKLKQFWDNLGEVPFFTWVIWAAYNTKDREVRIFQIIACFPGPGGLKLIGFLFQTCIVLTMLSTHRLGVGAVWLKKDSMEKKSWYFD